MSELAKKSCVPCRGGVPPLAGKELEALAKEVPQWKVVDGHQIVRRFTFPDFKQALALGRRDPYLLGAYADLLLDQGRAREAAELLKNENRADGLLLRLALAESMLTPRPAAFVPR